MGHVTFEQFGQVHKAPSLTEPLFADNTWEQIIKACQTNTVPDTWEVGDQKAMTIGEEEHMITIIGKNHDVDYDGNYAPLTLQMQDCLSTKYKMQSTRTNEGGWDASIPYNGEAWDYVKYSLPREVKNGIRSIRKYTSAGKQSSSIVESEDNDIFLLSEVEVFGTMSNSFAGEGTQYAYYAAGNSKVKKVDGTATAWWLRSPDKGTSTRYCRVSSSGTAGDYNADTENGISYAFCF